MAGEIKSTLTLDVSKFSMAIERATSNLNSLDKQLKNAKKVTADFEKSVSELGQDASASSDKFKLLEQTVAALAGRLNLVAQQGFDAVSKGARRAKKDVSDLAQETDKGGQLLLSASEYAKKYAVAMESIKPSLQKAVEGQKDLQKATAETTRVSEQSAAAQVASKTKVLEAERASNDKIIADKQRLASELRAIEQKIRNEALAHRVAADGIERRLGAYAGRNKISEALAPAVRLDNNADFVRLQREETLRTTAALEQRNAEIARAVQALAAERTAIEEVVVAERRRAQAAIDATAASKRQQSALSGLNSLIHQTTVETEALTQASLLSGEAALKASMDQIMADGRAKVASEQKRVALEKEAQANLGKNALLQTIRQAEEEAHLRQVEQLTAGEQAFKSNLQAILNEGAARKKATDDRIAQDKRAASEAARTARETAQAQAAADREAITSARQAAAERRRAAREAAAFEREQAQQIANMWKGMAGMWAASRIERGLKGTVNAASDAEQTSVLMHSLNFSEDHNQRIREDSERLANQLKFISNLDAIKSRMSAIASLGHDDAEVINNTLATGIKAANALANMGIAGHGDMQTTLRNLYGVVEMRQQQADAEGTNRTFDTMFRIITGTQGKVQTADMETVLRRLGLGASRLSDEGLINLAAIVDQFKVAGGDQGGGGSGVSTVGTAFKMMQSYALGKGLSNMAVKQFAGADILKTSGLDLTKDAAGVLKDAKHAGLKDAQLWLEDPVAAIQKIMPKIIEYTQKDDKLRSQFYEGKDINDRDNQMNAVAQYLNRLGITTTAANALFTAGEPRSAERIKHQRETIQNAKGVDAVDQDQAETYKRNVQEFQAVTNDLSVLVGNSLLPVINSVLEGFRGIMMAARDFAKDNPLVTQFSAITAAVMGTVLGVKSFFALFGAVGGFASTLGSLVGAFTGVTAATTTAGAAAAGAATAWGGMNRMLATLTLAFPRLGGAAASVVTAFTGMGARLLAPFTALSGGLARAIGGVGSFLGTSLSILGRLLNWVGWAALAGQFGWVIGKWISTIQVQGLSIGEHVQNIFLDIEMKFRALLRILEAGFIRWKRNMSFGLLDTTKDEAELSLKRALDAEYEKNMRLVAPNPYAGRDMRLSADQDPRVAALKKSVQDKELREAEIKRMQAEAAAGRRNRSGGGVRSDDSQAVLDAAEAAGQRRARIPREFEDAFAKAFSEATSRSNIQQLKLESLESGDASFMEQARQQVIKMWMGGDLDDGKDPSKRRFLKGGVYGADGRVTVDGKGYDRTKPWGVDQIDWNAAADVGGGEKKTLDDLVKAKTTQLELEAAIKATTFAKERARATDQEVSTAMARLTGTTEGQTDAMRALLREYARLEARTPGLKDNADYQAEKQKALINQAIADYANMGADLAQKNKELQAQFLTTERERLVASANAAFEAEAKKARVVQDALDAQVKALEDAGKKGSEEWNKAIEARKQGEDGFSQYMRGIAKQREEALLAPIDKLAREWKDVYKQVESMEADWSSKFMDNLKSTIVDGQADWAGFLKGMGADLLGTALKASVGDMVTGAFKSIGTTILGAFGLSRDGGLGKPDGTMTNPLFVRDVTSPLAGAAGSTDVTSGVQGQIKALSDTVGRTFSGLADTLKGAFSGLESIVSGVISSIATSAATGSATSSGGGIWGAIGSWIGSLFADGGVMTAEGSMPLRMYQSGGVASSPQMAIFGEGSMNEAYVPLPDGRSIPVKMHDGGSTPNVSVNVINQTGQQANAQQGTPRMDGQKMILDVVLTAMTQPGPYRDGLRSAAR